MEVRGGGDRFRSSSGVCGDAFGAEVYDACCVIYFCLIYCVDFVSVFIIFV